MPNDPFQESFALTERVSSASRLAELARVAGTALSAMMVCSPLLLASRPRTPLRVFCIAAFEFLARLRGGTLGRHRRIAMAHACDFGSLRDDFYDHRKLDATEYRALRSKLRRMAPEEATSRYIRQLRQAERGRPALTVSNPQVANAVMAYRTSVLDVSLRWMHEISGLRFESVKFHLLVCLVGLLQLADDVLDWKDDHAVRRPSYVTAFLVDGPRQTIAPPLRAHANALLQDMVRAAKHDAGAVPLALAGMLTWSFIIALLRLRFPQ
jgi:hypothetical protein